MTNKKFYKIAVMGRAGVPGVEETLSTLVDFLVSQHREVVLESSTATLLPNTNLPIVDAKDIYKHAELFIVVGGDGSLINAAHIAVENNLPILGVHRGRLGFLTDIHPNQLEKIGVILDGHYQEENRFLLQSVINEQHRHSTHDIALNDVVLLPGDIAQMIEFDLYVNDQLVCHHRADGMIIATPTGSTAYALSGGGPILHPSLSAIVLVPMFPHTLSSRPIAIKSESEIRIEITRDNETSPYVSCDGQNRIAVAPNGHITIKKYPKTLNLIHPSDYNYYHTLREKLNWEKQASRT
jgi:NAD+ kinase